MEFKDLVSISGKPGLFEMVKTRQDGMIVRGFTDGSKSFISSRKHNFTPLDNIGVYLESGDTVELKEVFDQIAEQGGNIPMASAPSDELRNFFREVLPEHDEDKVKISDIKKILQWYEELMNKDWFEDEEE